LLKLTARGITVFLTSHVLEIVERLCTHIAIITEGRLVVEGALGELRRGIALEDESSGGSSSGSSPLSLEDYFIRVIGGARPADEEMLTWLA
jgi:ABC-2 type transport system ATP-binding protein